MPYSIAHDDNAIVISQPWGGLGDNLQFSTLPELFSSHGLNVFISDLNKTHNPEIFDIVWGENPFVSGVVHKDQNAGSCFASRFDGGFPRFTNFIERIEMAHGLEAMNSHPKIYYDPVFLDNLENKVVVDIGAVTAVFSQSEIVEFLHFLHGDFHYKFNDMLQVSFDKQVSTSNIIRINQYGELKVASIKKYCDILFSCRSFITVHSGAHSLAAAIRGRRKEPNIHCLVRSSAFNRRNFIYPKVEYYVI